MKSQLVFTESVTVKATEKLLRSINLPLMSTDFCYLNYITNAATHIRNYFTNLESISKFKNKRIVNESTTENSFLIKNYFCYIKIFLKHFEYSYISFHFWLYHR